MISLRASVHRTSSEKFVKTRQGFVTGKHLGYVLALDTSSVLVLVNTYTSQQIQNTSRVLALEVSTDTSNMQSLGIIHVST